jgi:hypothetical protein
MKIQTAWLSSLFALCGLIALTSLAAPVRASADDRSSSILPTGVDRRPDLNILFVDVLFHSQTGYDKTHAWVFVQNQGSSPSKACTLMLQTQFGPFTYPVTTTSIPALQPGAVVSVGIQTPLGIYDSGVHCLLTADSFGVVNEASEQNNIYDINNL